MLHILNLFGRSPFAPLQGHMEKVADCVFEIIPLLAALKEKNYPLLNKIAERISELEHAADLTKNDIRNHLPGNLFLSIERNNFLDMLLTQDSIADAVEDAAVLLTLREMELYEALEKPFSRFVAKNIEAFEGARRIIQELHELLESSFGGTEAEKVKVMIEDVAFKEHEADVIQRDLLKSLYQIESKITYGVFAQWQKIFECIGTISDQSEKLANCVRMTLDVK
jgi:predicted phosphate transport protein (TIGR00153 family)